MSDERPPIRHFAVLRFRKAGPLRYLSHLDLNRAVDRAVRRAGLPVKYSQGFNPSAQIGYAHALPVGVAGERELCQIELERPVAADEVHRALVAQLPEDLQPVQTEVVSGEKRKHISGSTVAEYEMQLAADGQVDAEDLRRAVSEVLEAGNLRIVRETKTRTREIDIRPGIHELTVFEARPDVSDERCGPWLRMKLALQQEQLVKPSEVVECLERRLARLTGQDVRLNVRVVTRLDLQ
ncbi:MAG: TIGR03936 family radical SAM-associated protein [Armatimonadota bacterium]